MNVPKYRQCPARWSGRAHIAEDGYAGGAPYGRIVGGPIDGVGTEHVNVEVRCRYCGEYFTIAKFHRKPT